MIESLLTRYISDPDGNGDYILCLTPEETQRLWTEVDAQTAEIDRLRAEVERLRCYTKALEVDLIDETANYGRWRVEMHRKAAGLPTISEAP